MGNMRFFVGEGLLTFEHFVTQPTHLGVADVPLHDQHTCRDTQRDVRNQADQDAVGRLFIH